MTEADTRPLLSAMPAHLLDDPDAIVGASGAGKSYTGRQKVELLLRAGRHTIIFDPTGVWYGLRSDAAGTGPGFDIPIFGGPHGDIPIRPTNGAAIAGILIGESVSGIIDLSTFEEADLRLFALDFLDQLRERDRVNLHLVFDEAEEFAPQTAPDDIGFRLVRRMTWIAKRGRVFGLVPTFLTQRPADFAKAVLSQAQTLYFHQLIAPADQKPVVDYLKANADRDTLKLVQSSLAELARGERWIYSPRRKILERGFTPPIETFDSMATPAPGEAKRQPRTLAQLDVSKIRAALVAADPSDVVPADPVEAMKAGTAVGDAIASRDRKIAELEAQVVELEAELEANNEAGIDMIDRTFRAIDLLQGGLFIKDKIPGVSPGDAAGSGQTIVPAAHFSSTLVVDGGETAASALDRPAKPAKSEGDHPLALRLVSKMEELAPARLTWRQLSSLMGYSPEGGISVPESATRSRAGFWSRKTATFARRVVSIPPPAWAAPARSRSGRACYSNPPPASSTRSRAPRTGCSRDGSPRSSAIRPRAAISAGAWPCSVRMA